MHMWFKMQKQALEARFGDMADVFTYNDCAQVESLNQTSVNNTLNVANYILELAHTSEYKNLAALTNIKELIYACTCACTGVACEQPKAPIRNLIRPSPPYPKSIPR
jgi:hypothetical protein